MGMVSGAAMSTMGVATIVVWDASTLYSPLLFIWDDGLAVKRNIKKYYEGDLLP